jgi:hypothetical protein
MLKVDPEIAAGCAGVAPGVDWTNARVSLAAELESSCSIGIKTCQRMPYKRDNINKEPLFDLVDWSLFLIAIALLAAMAVLA